MGQQQNKNAGSFRSRLEDNYTVQQSNQSVTYMKCKSTQQIFLMKKISLTSTTDFNAIVQKAQKQKEIKHDHILSLHDFEIKSQNTFCSTFYQIYLIYEYSSYNLLTEIDARINQNRKFQEKQIWFIMCSCSLALAFLYRNNFVYMTIDPDQIFITANGVIKLAHPQNLPILISEPRKSKYYSPELLKNQNLKKSQKSCVFSVAMCIMQILLLQSLNDCYDYLNMKIDQKILQQKLKKLHLQGYYSKLLLQVLEQMLRIKQSERLGIIQLQSYLYKLMEEGDKFQKQITNVNTNNKENQKVNSHLQQNQQNKILGHKIKQKQKQKMPCPIMILESEQPSNQIQVQLVTHVDKEVPDESDDDGEIKNKNSKKQKNNNQKIHKNKVRIESYQTNTTISKPEIEYHYQKQKENQKQHATLPTHHDESIYALLKKQIVEISTKKEKLSARKEQKEYQIATQRASLQHNYVSSFTNNNRKRYSTQQYNKLSNDHFQSIVTQKEQKRFVNEIVPKGRYEGQKVGNNKHGFGTFYYKEGGKYTGEWFENRMNGRGTLYYPNNKKAYEGSWKEDKLNGHGILYNQEAIPVNKFYDFRNLDKIDELWVTYEGNFDFDNKSGRGKLTLSNGQTFEGTFQNDEANGEGLFTRMDNTQIRGIWKNNHLVKLL